MKFIKKNMKFIIIGIVVIVLALIGYVIWLMIPHTYKDLYGDRLDGIDKVKIGDNVLKDIDSDLEKISFVSKVDSNIQGRLINFEIKLSKDASQDIKDEFSKIVIDAFEKEELEFYDIQIFAKNKSFSLIGYKHKTSDKFIWSSSK